LAELFNKSYTALSTEYPIVYFSLSNIICLLQQVTEVKIKGGMEVTGRRRRRGRMLPDDHKERRGY
jgi:hypothetical protein